MNHLGFYLFAGLVGLLLTVFAWSLRNLAKRSARRIDPALLGDFPRPHVAYLPQVQQALKSQDFDFLISRGSQKLARRMQTERRQIARQYLANVREDFNKLLRLARVVAVLSPEVVAVEEFERFRLTVGFAWRYRLSYLALWLGYSPLPSLRDVCQLVSGLSIRIEGAMAELGERAAMAADLASSLDRRRLDSI